MQNKEQILRLFGPMRRFLATWKGAVHSVPEEAITLGLEKVLSF